MLRNCRKHKKCHDDLTLEKAMGCIQMYLISTINNTPDDAPDGDVCFMKRLAKSYDLIEQTLKENGLLNQI